MEKSNGLLRVTGICSTLWQSTTWGGTCAWTAGTGILDSVLPGKGRLCGEDEPSVPLVQLWHPKSSPSNKACFMCSSAEMAGTGKLACSPCEKGYQAQVHGWWSRLPVKRGSPCKKF